MHKINYKNVDIICKEYKDIFNLDSMNIRWESVINGRYKKDLSFFPTCVEDLLTARFQNLAEWAIRFSQLGTTARNQLKNRMSKIFTYDSSMLPKKRSPNMTTYSSYIASFFISHKDEIDATTCPYCELSYINLVPAKYHPQDSYRQFDLDHVLPKSQYPFAALSLYNLVPCCTFCNQKMKKVKELHKIKSGQLSDKEINGEVAKWVSVSPTSEDFNFADNVLALFIPSTIKNKDDIISFMTINEDLQEFIKIFELDGRYSYHSNEAKKLIELRRKYSDSYINSLVELLINSGLFVSGEKIKEDIFGSNWYKNKYRIFDKLRKDILPDLYK